MEDFLEFVGAKCCVGVHDTYLTIHICILASLRLLIDIGCVCRNYLHIAARVADFRIVSCDLLNKLQLRMQKDKR